jgi:hypothetical protein
MGRMATPKVAPTPPIPTELAELMDKDGRFKFRGFVEDPDGSIRVDPRRKDYVRLRRAYEKKAGVGLTEALRRLHS